MKQQSVKAVGLALFMAFWVIGCIKSCPSLSKLKDQCDQELCVKQISVSHPPLFFPSNYPPRYMEKHPVTTQVLQLTAGPSEVRIVRLEAGMEDIWGALSTSTVDLVVWEPNQNKNVYHAGVENLKEVYSRKQDYLQIFDFASPIVVPANSSILVQTVYYTMAMPNHLWINKKSAHTIVRALVTASGSRTCAVGNNQCWLHSVSIPLLWATLIE